MGKTYKDQRKYDAKRRDREDNFERTERKNRNRPYDEVIPDDEELDPYEELDYDYDYDR
jgi:hypothetical protein